MQGAPAPAAASAPTSGLLGSGAATTGRSRPSAGRAFLGFRFRVRGGGGEGGGPPAGGGAGGPPRLSEPDHGLALVAVAAWVLVGTGGAGLGDRQPWRRGAAWVARPLGRPRAGEVGRRAPEEAVEVTATMTAARAGMNGSGEHVRRGGGGRLGGLEPRGVGSGSRVGWDAPVPGLGRAPWDRREHGGGRDRGRKRWTQVWSGRPRQWTGEGGKQSADWESPPPGTGIGQVYPTPLGSPKLERGRLAWNSWGGGRLCGEGWCWGWGRT